MKTADRLDDDGSVESTRAREDALLDEAFGQLGMEDDA
jgi:hypothetical protein